MASLWFITATFLNPITSRPAFLSLAILLKHNANVARERRFMLTLNWQVKELDIAFKLFSRTLTTGT